MVDVGVVVVVVVAAWTVHKLACNPVRSFSLKQACALNRICLDLQWLCIDGKRLTCLDWWHMHVIGDVLPNSRYRKIRRPPWASSVTEHPSKPGIPPIPTCNHSNQSQPPSLQPTGLQASDTAFWDWSNLSLGATTPVPQPATGRHRPTNILAPDPLKSTYPKNP